MKTSITSRELLAEVGVSPEEKPEIPPFFRHLLITSVITFVSAGKLREALNNRGHAVTLRDVSGWQRATREWLGLPEAGRGRPSDECRNEVKQWLQENGNPTLEDIDAGWVPAHQIDSGSGNSLKSFPHGFFIAELRSQMKKIDAATEDWEAWYLAGVYSNAIRQRG